MELFYVIPAIIVLVYWIVEDPIKEYRFKSSSTKVNVSAPQKQIEQTQEPNSPVVSLVKKVKLSLEANELNYVMDEQEGMAWVMLADDDQYYDDRDVFILIEPDINTITYSIGIINNLAKEDIVPITELCNRLNDRITYGRFVLDYSDASVRLIIYYHLMSDLFSRKRHQMYFSALLQYRLDIESCFIKVKMNKELPIVAVMGK